MPNISIKFCLHASKFKTANGSRGLSLKVGWGCGDWDGDAGTPGRGTRGRGTRGRGDAGTWDSGTWDTGMWDAGTWGRGGAGTWDSGMRGSRDTTILHSDEGESIE